MSLRDVISVILRIFEKSHETYAFIPGGNASLPFLRTSGFSVMRTCYANRRLL